MPISSDVPITKNRFSYWKKVENNLTYLEPKDIANQTAQLISEDVLNSLQRYMVRKKGAYSTEMYTCEICYHGYSMGDYVICLPCRHKFHYYCIENWLKWIRPWCPVDRRLVISEKYFIDIVEDKYDSFDDAEDLSSDSCKLMHSEESNVSLLSFMAPKTHLPTLKENSQAREHHTKNVDENNVNLKKDKKKRKDTPKILPSSISSKHETKLRPKIKVEKITKTDAKVCLKPINESITVLGDCEERKLLCNKDIYDHERVLQKLRYKMKSIPESTKIAYTNTDSMISKKNNDLQLIPKVKDVKTSKFITLQDKVSRRMTFGDIVTNQQQSLKLPVDKFFSKSLSRHNCM